MANTPIARYDIVPHQRIGSTFKAGIVAFSKDGIDNVSFAIAGQGYGGTNPLVASAMTLNDRTDVWEYWVTINGSDFSTSGEFTITATITGIDTGSRVMSALPLLVDGGSTLTQYEAWVSTTGNNDTGEVDNESLPYEDIDKAIEALQIAKGSDVDGCIVYLLEGSYPLLHGTVATVNEWITITTADGATKANTILINAGTITTGLLIKAEGITLQSENQFDYIFSNPAELWVNDCALIGSGRWVAGSSPISMEGDPWYITNSTIYDADYGVQGGYLARNVTVDFVGNDAFVNTLCAINALVDDVDPGATGWHGDGYQAFGTSGQDNRIIFGYFGQDLNYQGLFLRGDTEHTNCAYVNIFMEMQGGAIASNGAMYGEWDHVLMWHCTFPSYTFGVLNEVTREILNSSFIGNVFWEFRDYPSGDEQPIYYGLPANAELDVFEENHFMTSYVDTAEGHVRSKSPDTVVAISQSLGDAGLDLADPESSNFGFTLPGSILLNRLSSKIVPIDALGNERSNTPDSGALEYISTIRRSWRKNRNKMLILGE